MLKGGKKELMWGGTTVQEKRVRTLETHLESGPYWEIACQQTKWINTTKPQAVEKF